jgi:hypothetical protein
MTGGRPAREMTYIKAAGVFCQSVKERFADANLRHIVAGIPPTQSVDG